MTIIYIILVVAGLSVIGAFIKIQLVEGHLWHKRAEQFEFETKEFTDEAHRGNIYSSDGKIMATTIPICNLYVDFGTHLVRDKKNNVLKDKNGNDSIAHILSDSCYYARLDEVCALLADMNIPGKDTIYYKDRFESEWTKDKGSRCYLIEKNIPYSTWDKIVKLKGWSRFVVKKVDKKSVIRQSREHIYGNMAANCIGFWNKGDNAKSTGLDGYYNNVLAGQDGLYECRRVTMGEWIPISMNDDEEQSDSDTLVQDRQKRVRIDGCDIVTTIDTRYQDIAETALRQALHKSGGTTQSSGCAILMEASTGYVLACSNLAWDTLHKEYRELPDKNIACTDLYEPGSTVKTVILTAIMNDSTVTIDTTMKLRAVEKEFSKLKDGTIRDDHWLFKDKAKKIIKDTLSLKEVIMISSNVGMCELAWTNYEKRRNDLKRLVESVFPYDVLHLDLKTGEYTAKVADINASARDFLNFCYGYAQSFTAMQLITFYNALANNGKMMKPMFCKAIIRDGEMQEIKPIVMRESICSKSNLKILNDLLVNVVEAEHGTAHNINDNSYGIAGKTGTAKYLKTDNLFDASFAGYFPAENPRYTCLVVVKKVSGYGRTAAAPVFKQIADCVVALDKTLENGKIEVGSRNGSKIIQVKRATNRSGAVEDGIVPDCHKMTAREAVAALEKRNLRVRITGHGRVIKQDIPKGTTVKKGTTVTLTLKTDVK